MSRISEKYGTQDLGDYYVANNAWNTDLPQEIEPTATGFKLVTADGSIRPDGPPKSYPSIVYGVHWDRRSPRTMLPVHVDTDFFRNMQVTVGAKYDVSSDAVYDCALDIWFDPTPKTTGEAKLEIMIWLDKRGPIQPIGSKVSDLGDFDVWYGVDSNKRVVSFVARETMTERMIQPYVFFDY